MLGLPIAEIVLLIFIMAFYLAAAIVGVLQLLTAGERYKPLLLPFVSLALILEVVILIFRAVTIKAVPLTGLFEFMIVLTIVFGLVYLYLSTTIRQVWFASVMVWIIFAMVLVTVIIAEPASKMHEVATTPWAIAHGATMLLGAASIMFAATSAFLYLLGSYRLKRKQIIQVLGRVPNIEKLEKMILLGAGAGFVLIALGIISGIGLVLAMKTSILEWLADIKVICILTAWILLGVELVLARFSLIKGKVKAYITMIVFALILFAILGVTILGITRHDFAL
jgi:ABC-type uncharacterized transport system permease subunit